MSEALLRAICERPQDVGLRLIMADWLGEHGQPEREELIRVQCELAATRLHLDNSGRPLKRGIAGCECRGCVLTRRERQLLDDSIVIDGQRYQPRCLWAVKCLGWSQWEFRRGFVEEVSCPAADWHAHGPAVVLCQPVLEVRISDRKPSLGPHGIATWSKSDWGTSYESQDDIPPEIFDMLPASEGGSEWATTGGESHALDLLSRACVRWARRETKLPTLEDE